MKLILQVAVGVLIGLMVFVGVREALQHRAEARQAAAEREMVVAQAEAVARAGCQEWNGATAAYIDGVCQSVAENQPWRGGHDGRAGAFRQCETEARACQAILAMGQGGGR